MPNVDLAASLASKKSVLHHLSEHGLIFTVAFDIVIAIVVSAHVILTKRDTRATIA